MKQYLNEHDIINSIRLELRHPSGKNHIWVLVEGETDQRLFSRLIDAPSARIEIAHGGIGKLRVAVDILIKETNQVLGIRDADFLNLNRRSEPILNLFITDYHDVEMMIVSCDDSFRPLIAEYLNERLSDFSILRKEILQSISFLAGIRWLNDQKNLEFNFEGLGLGAFYEDEQKQINKENCIKNIHERSKNRNRNMDEDEINLLIEEIVDYYNLCNGHDFIKALALHITFVRKKGIKDSTLAESLRISYRKEDFCKTNLFSSLRNWENSTGFNLFQ